MGPYWPILEQFNHQNNENMDQNLLKQKSIQVNKHINNRELLEGPNHVLVITIGVRK